MNRRDFFLGTLGVTALLAQPGCRGAPRPPTGTGYLYDDLFLSHDSGEGHRESPARLTAIRDRVGQAIWREPLLPIQPRAANLETLGLVHTPEYIDLVRAECESGATRLSTGDTNISPRQLLRSPWPV